MEDPNTKNSPFSRPAQQTDLAQRPISPVSTTTTNAGSMPPLPTHEPSPHLQTPHDATNNEIHPIDPLSNLAASSINTIEFHAKLVMSATSHETSMGDILGETSISPNMDIETGIFHSLKQSTIQPLPDFNQMRQKSLRPSPTGEDLERRQLEQVKGLLLRNCQWKDCDERGAKGKEGSSGKAMPHDVEGLHPPLNVEHEGEKDDTSNFQTTLQPQNKLTISTSTISLALSTTLSTPMNTPLTPKTSDQAPSDSTELSLTLKRQRSLSIQETEKILMGVDDDDDTSDSDEGEVGEPIAKKVRVDEGDEVFVAQKPSHDDQILNSGRDDAPSVEKNAQSTVNQDTVGNIIDAVSLLEKNADKEDAAEEEEKKEDAESNASKEAVWSARQHLGARGPDRRWRAHQIAEDYISLASSITLPPTYLGPFGYSPTTGQYPIEQVTALGYLTSPLRRPTVIEKWSPYEIVTFEAAITLHGKLFHQVQKWVKTKSTKEVVEFYYIWKKTSHYQRWKNQYEEEIEDGSGEEDVPGKGRGGSSGSRLPTSPARRGRR
ncbi:hypothetical protein ACHAW6_003387 [Cyclotella cf. meneghiniana]